MRLALFLLVFGFFSAEPRFEIPSRIPAVVSLGDFCTGFVVGEGTVVTAAHCVEKRTSVPVVFVDGAVRPFLVQARGSVDSRDWAILFGDTRGTQPLKFFSAPAQVERGCLSVGYGGGRHVQNSMPCEISVLKDNEGYVRFYGAVIPGDSGGPLLNDDGEIIGIVVRTGYPRPIGLATDIRLVLKALLKLKHEEVPSDPSSPEPGSL